MSTFLNILGALLILDIIVIVHELGHFLSARALNIPVLEFAVGMGPKIFSKKRKDTTFSIRAFPVGGFCAYMGEDDGDYNSPGALNNQPVWKRFITVLSGPLMNFVLAYVVLFLYFWMFGVVANVPMLSKVEQGMPAQLAGMQVGDVITSVNGNPLSYDHTGWEKMYNTIINTPVGDEIEFSVKRGDEHMTLTLGSQLDDKGQRRIGIEAAGVMQPYPRHLIVQGTAMGLWNITKSMLTSLKNLVFKGEGLDQTMGAVGMVGLMAETIRNGWETVFNFFIVISLNLGIMNLLPLPALDGGRLMFLLLEAIRRKPVKPEFEGWVHAGGFLLLMGLIVVITAHDIWNLVQKAIAG